MASLRELVVASLYRTTSVAEWRPCCVAFLSGGRGASTVMLTWMKTTAEFGKIRKQLSTIEMATF